MSLIRYAAYRDSGVAWLGEVPSHWSVSQSRRLFAVRSEPASATDKTLTASQKYGVLFQSDFAEREGRRVAEVIMGTDSLTHVEPDDLIISMRSFQGGIEWSKLRGSTSFHYVMLRPVKHVHPPYFAHLLKSASYIQALRTTTDLIRDGQELRYSNFVQVDLPLVPMDEQKGIAAFLDHETAKIDALVDEQKRLIGLLKEKRQAVISQAVTKGLNPSAPMKDSGVEWLGQVPAHWDVLRVKTASTFLTSGPRGWSEHVSENGALFVQSGDLTEALSIDFENAKRVVVTDDAESKRTLLKVGDVLVCITGAKTGKVAVCEQTDEPAFINQHTCLIRPAAGIRPSYLGAYLLSESEQRYFELTQYGLKQGLSLENVKQAAVPVPPQMEQGNIVNHVNQRATELDALTLAAEMSITRLQERRATLISAAVTGKIDVRRAVTRPEIPA